MVNEACSEIYFPIHEFYYRDVRMVFWMDFDFVNTDINVFIVPCNPVRERLIIVYALRLHFSNTHTKKLKTGDFYYRETGW